MKTACEIYRWLTDKIVDVSYEVNPRISLLEIGDVIVPENIVGYHPRTGKPVIAGLGGQVINMRFNPANASEMVLTVISKKRTRKGERWENSIWTK